MKEYLKNYSRFELIIVSVVVVVTLIFIGNLSSNLQITYTQIDFNDYTISDRQQISLSNGDVVHINYEMILESEEIASLLIWIEEGQSILIDLMKIKYDYIGSSSITKTSIDFDRNISSQGLKMYFLDMYNGINIDIIAYESLGFTFDEFLANATDSNNNASSDELNQQFLNLYTSDIEVFSFKFRFEYDAEKKLTHQNQILQGLIFMTIIGGVHVIIVLLGISLAKSYHLRQKYHTTTLPTNNNNNLLLGLAILLGIAFPLLVVSSYPPILVVLYIILLVYIILPFITMVGMSYQIRNVKSVIYLIPLSFSHLIWFFYWGLTSYLSLTSVKLPDTSTSFYGMDVLLVLPILSIVYTIFSATLFGLRYIQTSNIHPLNILIILITYMLHVALILYIA